MAKRTIETVKLGAFVIAGLFFLILALYIIGKEHNLFGKQFTIKAHFEHVSGLNTGNNVRFSGIDIGTVQSVEFLADTLIEVTMTIDVDMKNIIRKNVVASIGTDGLIGNKLVNLSPVREAAPLIEAGDLVQSEAEIDTDAMLRTLQRTNENVAQMSEDLKNTVRAISNSTQLMRILNDETLAPNLRQTLANLRRTSSETADMMDELHSTLSAVRQGQGSLGALLTDTTIVFELEGAAVKLNQTAQNAERMAAGLEKTLQGIDRDIQSGSGPAHALLKDSLMADNIAKSLQNIEQGTAAFSENMEALKHNFLLRRYFKKKKK